MNISNYQNARGDIHRLRGRLGKVAVAVSLLLVATFNAFAQTGNDPYDMTSFAKQDATANPAAGAGMMVAGELWDSFLPQSVAPYYGEAATTLTGEFIRIGNFDRAWSSPTHMWPGGWTNGNLWTKGMGVAEWNPDPTFNPATIGGVANPAYSAASGPNYALASVRNVTLTPPVNVPGFTDPTRKYQRETKWVDPNTRHHAVYEAGWPTNIGVDVKMEIHQYTLNWNNFNDFIIVKLTFKNTGVKDINADGVSEATNNVIHALTVGAHAEVMTSYNLNRAAGRANRFGATRALGYIGDNDPSGAPWDIAVAFPGESAAGKKDLGLNDWPSKFYTDVWTGWSWLGAFDSTGVAVKKTIFGTDPVGVGPQRGWYTSAGQARGLSSFYGFPGNNAKQTHTLSMGTFYKNGGRTRSASELDLSPDPNFFASGTAGNPETFVPKATPTRPNGDRKLYSVESPTAFEAPHYQGAAWAKGYSAPGNFDGDLYSGVGPFRLNVGESMTVYFAEVGGYRLQGIANAMAAARYTLANNLNPPVLDAYPAVPNIRVDNTTKRSVVVRWDNKAETPAALFAGYKIYKAALSRQVDWLQTGMRGLDKYNENTTPGKTPDALKRAVDPTFDVAGSGVAGKLGVADSWGPYELVAVITPAQLAQYADATATGFNYSYEDKQVGLGFKYWFYVAAYTNTAVNLGPNYVSFAGSNSATANTLETSNVNRNGASGLWVDTYPFADLNAFYPKTAQKQREIGAGFIVKAALVNPADIVSGKTKIGVYPNPYKKKAFFDSAVDAFDHKVAFYNLPGKVKITILDVAGQVIKQINFESTDPNGGSTFWDLFSKDGIEVASGLYIYVAEYNGGQQVGYFSIMR